MKWLARIGLWVALAAAGVALVVLFLSAGPQPEPLLELASEEKSADAPEGLVVDSPRPGGVYAGVVVDTDARPIRGANVLLIAYSTGSHALTKAGEREVARVGAYDVGGEAVPDPEGRFRIAADAQGHITRVLAYHKGHFMEVIEVTGPREDLRLVLATGGRVIGTVVDHETGSPVPGALVDVFLQQKVSKAPELDEGVSYGPIKRKQHKIAWLATLGRFIPKVLGPRIYGLPYEGTETLRLRTDSNGHFEIGPLGNKVQLEFVITHSKYMWIDFDALKGDKEGGQTPSRTVVEPGETIEREFRLRKGQFVSGQIVDDKGKGVEDVSVMVQSISAYYRHWWYRHKYRSARTDREGRFRVDGLAIGSQQLKLSHPSFGTKYETAEAGTSNLVIVAERLGGLHGTVEGIPIGKAGRPITVVLHSTEGTSSGNRQRREKTRLKANNTFLLERLRPGSYRTWIVAGREGSQPVEVTIKPYAVEKIVYEMGGGGTIQVRGVDKYGGLVDPVNGRLVAIRKDKEVGLGYAVSREGILELEGVVPGRYRLRLQSPRRVPVTTDIFEVSAGRVTVLPTVTLREWGFLRFGVPVDETGRPASIPNGQLLQVEYRAGEGPFRRLHKAGSNLAVPPGSVTIRARAGNLRYEGTVKVDDGETVPVSIILRPER